MSCTYFFGGWADVPRISITSAVEVQDNVKELTS